MDEKKLLSSVSFSNIIVNEVDESGGIFVGENIQCNWSSHSKQNYGFGIVYGIKNEMYSPVSVVVDPDTIDHPIEQVVRP